MRWAKRRETRSLLRDDIKQSEKWDCLWNWKISVVPNSTFFHSLRFGIRIKKRHSELDSESIFNADAELNSAWRYFLLAATFKCKTKRHKTARKKSDGNEIFVLYFWNVKKIHQDFHFFYDFSAVRIPSFRPKSKRRGKKFCLNSKKGESQRDAQNRF